MQTVPLKVEEHALALASSGFSTEKKVFLLLPEFQVETVLSGREKFFKTKTAR